MRVLITGGAGFLGSHLALELARRGDSFVALDDLSSGDEDNLQPATRVALVNGSVLDRELVDAQVARADAVLHAAAVVGVDRVAADPDRARAVIEDGTALVLDAARRHARPLISFSSSEVYGFAPPLRVREDDLPDAIEGAAPRLAYARAKLVADRAALRAAAEGQRVLALRPFNVVGARQSDDGGAVLPRLVERALAGEALELHGDGSQRRTFLEARDLARMVADLLHLERWPFAALNIGGREECSIRELAQRVAARLRPGAPIRCVAPPWTRGGVEVRRRVPDLSRLESLVDARPRFTLDDAIAALAAPAAMGARVPV